MVFEIKEIKDVDDLEAFFEKLRKEDEKNIEELGGYNTVLEKTIERAIQIGDYIQIKTNGTIGLVTGIAGENIVFRTFDRPLGWVEQKCAATLASPIKKPKKSKKHLKLEEFLNQKNRQAFILKKDFITYLVGGQELVVKKGEMVFLDEIQSFIGALKSPDRDGNLPGQLYVAHGNDNIFTTGRFWYLKRAFALTIPFSYLEPKTWDTTMVDRLELPDKERLVTFISKDPEFKNYGINFHKGLGKVILLYGEIGSGKTLTVEAISNFIKRPIIRMDVEDRSSSMTIQESFELAERYNAILLVDEAEMLISDRISPQTRIEAVQTLLKYIEGFSGIVIFTTNYAGFIDPAIENRIDLKIHYSLTPETRTEIWKKSLPPYLQKIFNYEKYKDYDINGRDIQKILLFSCHTANKIKAKKLTPQIIYDEIERRVKEKGILAKKVGFDYAG